MYGVPVRRRKVLYQPDNMARLGSFDLDAIHTRSTWGPAEEPERITLSE
jgi:hypothetical protein